MIRQIKISVAVLIVFTLFLFPSFKVVMLQLSMRNYHKDSFLKAKESINDMKLETNQAKTRLAPITSNYIVVRDGDFAFGVSKYGEICSPSVGLEYTSGYEHIAVGFYLEGYTIAYYKDSRDNLAYSVYGSRSSIVPVGFYIVENSTKQIIIKAVTKTRDSAILISSLIIHIWNTTYIEIICNITNNADVILRNVVFKRNVDLDVDSGGTYGWAGFDNYFDWDPQYNLAYAWTNSSLGGLGPDPWHYVGLVSFQPTNKHDLNGWDDYNRRDTNQDCPDGPVLRDGLITYHWELGDLLAGTTVNISMALIASHSYSELVSIANTILHPIRVNILNPTDGSLVEGVERVCVEVSSDMPVDNVSLRIDDEPWIDITSNVWKIGYYYYDWDTTKYMDGIHSITIKAYSSGGGCDEKRVYVLVDNTRSSILIVNDDPSSSYLDSYVKALESLGLTLHNEFEFWNATLTTPRMLNLFSIVIWYTGDSMNPLSSKEQKVIVDYLDNGGNLFISSRALGDSLNGTSFYENYIKAILRDHIGITTDYVFFNDTVEAGVDGWTCNGTWSITSGAYHSPTSCWYSGKYDNDTTIILESSTMDISFYKTAYLSFWTNYSLENQSDFGYIEVSMDGGLTWVTLGDVTGNQTNWVQMTFNITPYISAKFKIRFRLTSNPTISYDGWWIDDIVIKGDALEPIVASSGSIFMGSYWLTGNDSADNALGSDKIENMSGATLFFEYYTGGVAAIGYEGVYKLIYFAFPFESIKNSSSRSYITKKIIEYLNVTGTPTTIVTPRSLTVPLFGNVTINIKLESGGAGLGNREVEFFIKLGDKWVSLGTKKTSSDGAASLSLINVTYPVGTYKIAVVFYGDTTYARSVGFMDLNVRKLYTKIEVVGSTKIYDSGGQINIKIADEHNKTFVVDVMLEVGGMAFQSRTDEGGSASIWVYGVKPGAYKALIWHPSDEYRYANCTKFTLTVSDDDPMGPSITLVSQPTSVEYDEDLIIEASITDESGVYGATICYSVNNGSQKNVSMAYDAERGVWRGVIPAEDLVYGQVSWFIVAYDADADYKGDSASSKSETVITSVVDNTPPEIRGYSVSPLEPKVGDAVIVRVDIYEPEDASGISSVVLELRQSNATIATYNMTLQLGLYTAVLGELSASEYVCVIIAQDAVGNNATVEFALKVGGVVEAGIGLVPEILISFALIGVAIILIGIIAYLVARKPEAK